MKPGFHRPLAWLVFRSFGVAVAWGGRTRKHRRCLYPPLVRRSADASWADLTGFAGRVAVVVAAGVHGAVVPDVLRAGGGAGRAGPPPDGVRDAAGCGAVPVLAA